MPTSELRDDIQMVLLDKIRESHYPSLELMNRFEEQVRDLDQAHEYVQVLADKVRQDRFPSLQLLDRLMNMISRVEAVEAAVAAAQRDDS